MRIALLLLALGFTIIAVAIAYGFIIGDFFGEARVLLGYPWFHISMVDLYLGFFLFGGWIAFRERSPWVAACWIVSLCLLGNLSSCAYGILALYQSRGNWRKFWMGSRADFEPSTQELPGVETQRG